MTDRRRVLVIGYGNPGRLDDGLGPALAERIEALALPGVTVEANYHLAVEDAEAIARCDAVIFADAHTSVAEPFSLTPVAPAEHVSFSTHSLSPAAAVALARGLFDATAQAYVLAIRGYEFNEFGQGLSPAARDNLDEAVEALASMLTRGVFTPTRPGPSLRAAHDKDLTCKTENT
jgi:hydrogenase maturation protease